MSAASLSTAAGGLAVLAGVALLLPRSSTVTTALIVLAGGEAVAAGVTWGLARQIPIRRVAAHDLGRRLADAWPFALSSIIVYSYYLNVDTILLAALRGDADAGLYSAPYRLFLALNVVAVFAAYALMPAAKRVAFGISAEVSWQRVARALAAYGLVVLAATEAVGDAAIEAIFGPEFAGLGDVLVILCAGMPWYTLAYPLGYATIADNDRRTYLYGAVVAGIVATAGSLTLIPALGIEGAAVATALSLVAGSVVWIRRLPRIRRPPADAVVHATAWTSLAFLVALDVAPSGVAGLVTGVAGLALGIRAVRRA